MEETAPTSGASQMIESTKRKLIQTKLFETKGNYFITTSKFDDLISHIAALRFSDFQKGFSK